MQSQSPIVRQIITFGIISGAISLILACFGFGVVEFYKIKNETIIKLNSQLDILAYNVQPTLLFEDKDAANKMLLSMQNDPSINRVRIYKSDGKEFASLVRLDRDGDLKVARTILDGTKPIGRLEIESAYVGIKERYWTYFLISLVITILSIPALYFISAPLRHQVSRSVIQLVETTEALQRSNQDLEQFAYVASHDLQEPIRKVVGFSQLFAQEFDGKMTPKSMEYMSHVVNGAKRMQVLIQDLLQYSRVSSGELTVEPVSFAGIVREALQNLDAIIKETRAQIHCEELPTLTVHKVQIVQLFQNIIGNAIKYRGTLDPDISITAEQDNAEWVFSVKDNGIGISPQFYDKIFIIFQRLHGRNSQYTGTGIGLAICKRIVERHSGRIWVESIPGTGSIFKFTLPNK